jgi:hypothetical protein
MFISITSLASFERKVNKELPVVFAKNDPYPGIQRIFAKHLDICILCNV